MFEDHKLPWLIFKARANRNKKDFEAIWKGKNKVRRDFEWIPFYFQYRRAKEPAVVDDKTWSDLEMEEAFARIDRTTSVMGRQYLYAALRIYNNASDAEIERHNKLYALFRNDSVLRENIQKVLYSLRHDNAGYVATLLFEELPSKPKYYFLFYLSSGLFFLSLALIYFFPVCIFAAALFALINLSINAVYGRVVFQHFADLSHLTTMLSAVEKLARITPPAPIAELDTLRNHKDLASKMNKHIFWLCLDEAQTSELAAAIFGFLNMFGMSKLIAFLRTVDDLLKYREQIHQIFEAIGSLDMHIAVASWLESLPASTVPSFNSTATIDVSGMYHPLIENAIGNSVILNNESMLITGSNMAGKTTFIKTIGINMIFAQTLFVCLAERAILPRLIVRSSIKGEERVIDGNSYYSREVEEIRGFLNCDEGKFLFLIDEIFRGTNTIERISIAAASIRHLSRRNLVLVTTHDVELQGLLEDCSRMFHFSEQVDGNRYYFDYILRSGPCRSGNAIRLIELKGYPSSVVAEARGLAANMR